MALVFQVSLTNGGPASLVYGSIFAAFGSLAIALSLAEMASMYVGGVRPGDDASFNHKPAIQRSELSTGGQQLLLLGILHFGA